MYLSKIFENIIRKNFYIYYLFISFYKKFPNLFPFLEKKKYLILANSNFHNILDIGCNNFQTMKIMYSINKNLNFYLFDPIIKNKKKIPKTKIFNFALSNKRGNKILFMPYHNGINLDSLNSFELKNILAYKNKYLKNLKLKIKKKIVKTVTIDSLNLKSDFIKLDVENHEYEVLKGGKKHLQKNKPIILLENNKKIKKVSSFLSSINYKPYKILNRKFVKNSKLLGDDIFFFHDTANIKKLI
tara:strand:+ start:596 stop:1324 length:729 start_codon:yes stop_codon:yes gene_type:complete